MASTGAPASAGAVHDPPPRSAREVLTLGETRQFVVQAIDTPRRGIDLAMPGAEVPVPEPVEDDDVDLIDDAEVPAAVPPAEPPAVVEGEQKLSVSQRRKLRAQQQAEAARARRGCP